MTINRIPAEPRDDHAARLTAYALGQLDGAEQRDVEAELARDDAARQSVAETRRLAAALSAAVKDIPASSSADDLQTVIEERLAALDGQPPTKTLSAKPEERMNSNLRWIGIGIAICAVIVVAPLIYLTRDRTAGEADQMVSVSRNDSKNRADDHAPRSSDGLSAADPDNDSSSGTNYYQADDISYTSPPPSQPATTSPSPATYGPAAGWKPGDAPIPTRLSTSSTPAESSSYGIDGSQGYGESYYDPASPSSKSIVVSSRPDAPAPDSYKYGGTVQFPQMHFIGPASAPAEHETRLAAREGEPADPRRPAAPVVSNEQYDRIVENPFVPVAGEDAVSTFSIDVDTASYANVRRFLNEGRLPPPDAVRIEELINYFHYDYPQPEGEVPFSVNMEVAESPWQPGHRLLRVGLKGKEVQRGERPASNLVFLLDVSGSMGDENKLALLKQGLKMLVGELTENDRVTIVTYAGNAGLKLDATRGDQTQTIRAAIDSLSAGGSTNGSAGIQLAYDKAAENFIKEGTNRVLLATDGDLNVGVTSDEELVKLIKQKAAGGVFLTVLGFGTGNLKDAKMEKLADNGNGVYAYIDNLREARKVLVEQMSGSLVTIAKDVKIQLEFNPAEVRAYRLIGYENRLLATEDFDNDKKDAGEIGAGHTVTALYELIPVHADEAAGPRPEENIRELKYQRPTEPQKPQTELTKAAGSGELLTLALRYKQPDQQESRRIEFTVKDTNTRFNRASEDFQFAASVAAFGMLLRGSEHAGAATMSAVEEIASGAIGGDPKGYRTEFLDLVRRAAQLGR